MLMTTMSTFISTTVHCARCHDHKFDPVSQREYYALQSVFAGVDRSSSNPWRVTRAAPGCACGYSSPTPAGT